MFYSLKKILYRFQYAKYVGQLPFYMIREFTIKESYTPEEVNYAISTHGFNKRYSPIGYAMFCTPEQNEIASTAFRPCPSHAEIRRKIAADYFNNNADFNLHKLMQCSFFKAVWMGRQENPAVDEYWRYIVELEDAEEEELDRL